MRILVISNLYPPYYIGGYELACKDVVEGLRLRGHEVTVLTSTYGVTTPEVSNGVHRLLNHSFSGGYKSPNTITLWESIQYSWNNYRLTKRFIKQFKPDIIYLWCLGNISTLFVMLAAESSKIPPVYHIFDYWLQTTIEECKERSNILKHCVRLIGKSCIIKRLKIDNLTFGSKRLREIYAEHGITSKNSKVIYHGIHIQLYPAVNHLREDAVCKLLYAGQLIEAKGVKTIIEALSILIHRKGFRNFSLDIAGGGSMDYIAELKELIDNKLQKHINFCGKLPREELRNLFQSHDVFIFSSIWEEPFGIVLLEAMASGMAVIGTGTGGSKEILVDGESALVYPPGDSEALANAILRLAEDERLRARLGKKAVEHIRANFDIQMTIDRVEEYLQEVLAGFTTEE